MAVDKLVDSTQLDADLTSVANAIRTKGGTSAQLAFPAGFVSAVEAIPSGSTASADDLFNKRWPSGDITLTTKNTVNQTDGFQYQTGITGLRSTSLTAVNSQSFRGCSNMTFVDLPNVTRVGQTSSSSQDAYTFGNCTKLTSFNLPKLVNSYGQYNFAYCGSSSNKGVIVLPKIKELGYRTFRSSHLSAVDLGPEFTTTIRDDTFRYGSCDILILRSASVVAASNANAILELTAALGCTIYVPSALISSYESATNWSSETRTFASIEGSIYETQYADGTPIA